MHIINIGTLPRWYQKRYGTDGAQLARNAKNDKKAFYTYIGQQNKIKENVTVLINKTEEVVTNITGKTEVLHNFFVSVFNGNLSSHNSQALEPQGRDWRNEVPPIMADQV